MGELKAGAQSMVALRRCLRHIVNHPKVLFEAKTSSLKASTSLYRKSVATFVKDSTITSLPGDLPYRLQKISMLPLFQNPPTKPSLSKYKTSQRYKTKDPMECLDEFDEIKGLFLKHCKSLKLESKQNSVRPTLDVSFDIDSNFSTVSSPRPTVPVVKPPRDFFDRFVKPDENIKDRPPNWGKVEVESVMHPHLNETSEDGIGYLNFTGELHEDMKMAELFTKYYGKPQIEPGKVDFYEIAAKLMRPKRRKNLKQPTKEIDALRLLKGPVFSEKSS